MLRVFLGQVTLQPAGNRAAKLIVVDAGTQLIGEIFVHAVKLGNGAENASSTWVLLSVNHRVTSPGFDGSIRHSQAIAISIHLPHNKNRGDPVKGEHT